MRRLRPHLTYANVMATAAVFLALGGGAYAAVGSIPGADGVIHGCYRTRTGGLRVVAATKRCTKGEKAIAFNQKGVPGPPGTTGGPGAPGAPGSPGASGEQGPQGPGAASLSTTVAAGADATLATLSNNLVLEASCHSGNAGLILRTADNAATFEGSGTATVEGKTLLPLEENGGTKETIVSVPGESDFDLIARGNTTAKFERVSAHGRWSLTGCTYWGMITPTG
jgi:hypothetical protein